MFISAFVTKEDELEGDGEMVACGCCDLIGHRADSGCVVFMRDELDWPD